MTAVHLTALFLVYILYAIYYTEIISYSKIDRNQLFIQISHTPLPINWFKNYLFLNTVFINKVSVLKIIICSADMTACGQTV